MLFVTCCVRVSDFPQQWREVVYQGASPCRTVIILFGTCCRAVTIFRKALDHDLPISFGLSDIKHVYQSTLLSASRKLSKFA